MSTGWLRCRVYNGMFSDELAVQYPPGENAPAYFVPKEKVKRDQNGEGQVSVHVFSTGAVQWAVLPTDDQKAVRIREADLIGT